MVPISKWSTLRSTRSQDLLRRQIEQRVRPQRAADATHDHRGVEAVAGDVADDDPQRARRQREEVVPVAADRTLLRGHVARREFQALAPGQA